MKKIYTLLFICAACLSIKATSFTITTVGFAYSPASLTVTAGDVITIQTTTAHPTAQVDAATWNANGTSTVTGGWGVQTNNYTFTASVVGTMYYVCTSHVLSMQMKGKIDVVPTVGINEKTAFLNNFELFPNPATNTIGLNFSLNANSSLSAKLFNVLGQEVCVLISNTNLQDNNYSYKLDVPANIPSGTYFVLITANENRFTKKLVIAK